MEKLTTEEELSGLFNLALVGLSQLIKDGTFNHVENINALSNYYLQSKDNIAKFIQEKCVLNDNVSIVSQSLFDAYSSFCRAAQVKAVDYGSFGAYLKKMGIGKSRPMKSQESGCIVTMVLDSRLNNCLPCLGYFVLF